MEALLSERTRIKYTDQNKEYSLRSSKIHSLGEVGKFRVVAVNDLAEFAYNSDRSRARNDVENLESRGLLTQTTIADLEHNATPFSRSPRKAQALVSRQGVPSDQATYHGLKKPKEAFRGADLYRFHIGSSPGFCSWFVTLSGALFRQHFSCPQGSILRIARSSQECVPVDYGCA